MQMWAGWGRKADVGKPRRLQSKRGNSTERKQHMAKQAHMQRQVFQSPVATLQPILHSHVLTYTEQSQKNHI